MSIRCQCQCNDGKLQPSKLSTMLLTHLLRSNLMTLSASLTGFKYYDFTYRLVLDWLPFWDNTVNEHKQCDVTATFSYRLFDNRYELLCANRKKNKCQIYDQQVKSCDRQHTYRKRGNIWSRRRRIESRTTAKAEATIFSAIDIFVAFFTRHVMYSGREKITASPLWQHAHKSRRPFYHAAIVFINRA